MRAMTAAPFQAVPVKYAVTRLGAGATQSGQSIPGGLDLTTPSLTLQPGALRDSLNFECAQSGGYSRIQGYERYDGRSSPSAAGYTVVQVASFTNVPTAAQVVTQAGSGASGTIVAVVTTPTPYLIVTQITGTFNSTGALTTPGPIAVGTAVTRTVSISSMLNAQYLAGAADVYRANIGAVPGSGAILGVVGMIFNNADNVYAFRANVGGTAVALHKSSASGWTLVPFYNLVSFTNGGGSIDVPLGSGGLTVVAGSLEVASPSLTVESAGGITVQGELDVSDEQPEPQDGDTLIQGAVTATIKRVMWQSGAWAGTAAGQFVVTNPTGGNFSAGYATTTSGAVVTLSGPQAAITMQPGGHFEFVKANFSGQSETRRIYGCDGVNQCFEFDGDALAPIATGLSPDAPSHICFHKDFLFVSQSSSISYSGAGTPYKWGVVDGGGEIATGDIVTNLLPMPGSESSPTLGVYLRSNTSFLYGADPTTFNYVSFNTGTGALPHSAQNLFDTFVMDDLGVVTLKATLNWGNFLPSALTKNILPFIIQERSKLVASCVNRSKSQYRLFFSDGYGLWLTTVNQQFLGSAVILFPNPVFCVDEGENTLGMEITYFGSSDSLGYVYQLDAGTSFDGAAVNAHITTAWNPIGTPRILKRFRAASVEMQGTAYAAISFGYQLGYGTPLIGQPLPVNAASGFSSAPMWDAFTWDNFVWDGQTLSPTDVDMTGTGENVQFTITAGTNYIDAFTINSIITHWTPRRGMRV